MPDTAKAESWGGDKFNEVIKPSDPPYPIPIDRKNNPNTLRKLNLVDFTKQIKCLVIPISPFLYLGGNYIVNYVALPLPP